MVCEFRGLASLLRSALGKLLRDSPPLPTLSPVGGESQPHGVSGLCPPRSGQSAHARPFSQQEGDPNLGTKQRHWGP